MKENEEKKPSAEAVDSAGCTLNDQSRSLATRFRALFLLRNAKCDASVGWICKAFSDSSALLKHELAYCLGQMQNPAAVKPLIDVLGDVKQEPMVRHEAGEALGAIADVTALPVLQRFQHDPVPEVAETCQLALKRMAWRDKQEEVDLAPVSIYDSIDPAPADSVADVAHLSRTLIAEEEGLWERYRAMFALRNISSPAAVKALARGLYCGDSALFRHEIAYVLGQLQSPLAIPELAATLKNADESGMVRHECAEALGAIATPECTEILKEYARDNERVVRESCEVALDMAEYEANSDFQYAKFSG